MGEADPSPSPFRGEGDTRVARRGEGPGASAPDKTLLAGDEASILSAADAAGPHPGPPHKGEGGIVLDPAESALTTALDTAEPRAAAAIDAEDFAGAMLALSTLRAPIDAFFESVTINDPDPAKRSARLALLARVRDAVHRVADFSKIEG